MDATERNWAMALHLSFLAIYVIPLAGIVAPIVIWQIKKDEIPSLDAHGRMVTNFIISWAIYCAASFLLVFVLIGIPLLWALGIVSVVYPIIGGVQAQSGRLWSYPLVMRFL